MLNNIETR